MNNITHNFERASVKVGQHQVITYSAGNSENTLLLLHGGPGVPCNSLRDPHLRYASQNFRLVTWDQLGCGESDKPSDTSLWTIDRFVEEVEIVRTSLNLGKVHLLGHSWGGVLGMEYCLRYPDAVNTFVIAHSAFDLQLMQRGFERVKAALGYEAMRMMALREAEGTTTHPEYQAASILLMYRHMCRTETWPEELIYSINNITQEVLETTFGKYLFNCTGSLKTYNRIADLHKVKQPCLIIHGEYDYIVPECATLTRDYLPNAELHILRNCSHHSFIENPQQYHEILSTFLQRHS